jgi:hypothetical protein
MEAARTSETLVNFYQTTRCYNPEDSNLHTHRRENLKSFLNFNLTSQYLILSSDLEALRFNAIAQPWDCSPIISI